MKKLAFLLATQPLTSGVRQDDWSRPEELSAMAKIQPALSDVIGRPYRSAEAAFIRHPAFGAAADAREIADSPNVVIGGMGYVGAIRMARHAG